MSMSLGLSSTIVGASGSMLSRMTRSAAPGLSPLRVEGSGRLLDMLRVSGASTISSLALRLGVSRSTVVQRLDFLAASGLVQSEAAAGRARGRPAALSRFNPRAGIVLATQVGLSGCQLGVTDLAGELVATDYLDVDFSNGSEALLADLRRRFAAMLRQHGSEGDAVVGIGIGLPSQVELQSYARGLGLSATSWDREMIREGLQKSFDAPVFLDLDVNLIALAEQRVSWPEVEVCVGIKLGTLIDAAIVVNGMPVRGADGLAGELGHTKVSGSVVPCGCGGVGCLNVVASGDALVRQLNSDGVEVAHVADVVELALSGEPRTVAAVREAGRRIGEALASTVSLLNPAVISVWGYLADTDSILFAGIREGLYRMALPGSSANLKLVKTSLGSQAGVRGAAMRVLDEMLHEDAIDRMLVEGSWTTAWHPRA